MYTEVVKTNDIDVQLLNDPYHMKNETDSVISRPEMTILSIID